MTQTQARRSEPHTAAAVDRPQRPASADSATTVPGRSAPIARVVGRLAAGAFAVAGRVRPSPKPLHPRGAVQGATLARFGLEQPVGVAWLDEPGSDVTLVRLSRSAGLPAPLPDVLGLALRVPSGAGHADLLFSTSGKGRFGRFVLAPARRPEFATYSTLVPYRTSRGPAVLTAVGCGNESAPVFELRVAIGRGPWQTFGRLELEAAAREDADIAFDAVTNPVPGLEPYEWVRQLRAGAYRAARRSRGDDRVRP
jgi:hypothetical protein